MKKALLLVTTGVALLLAGCSNNSSSSNSSSSNDSTYKTEMTKGNDAVNDENYSKAADHFTSANKAKKTDKAKASKTQAQYLVKSKKLMNQREFSDAKAALNKVKDQENGNKKMTSRAKTLLKQVAKIQLNRNNFKIDIKNAKDMIKQGSNSQAKSLLEQVTNFKGVKGKYYSDLYTQAKTLLDSLPAEDTNKAEAITATQPDSSTEDQKNSTADASSQADQSDNPAANGHFDVEKKEVNGKEITAADIANARQQLTDSGVKNVGAWSDNDIVRAIKNAAKDDRSTITADDGKIQ